MESVIQEIFMNTSGTIKSAHELSQTVLIIPEIYDAPKIKFFIKEWLLKNKIEAVFLPNFITLFDLARQLAGINTGKLIRSEDFKLLLEKDHTYDLPVRFKAKKYKNYKNHLFMLLNLISLTEKRFRELRYTELNQVELTEPVYNQVIQLIKDNDYYFRGDIFKIACQKLDEQSNKQQIIKKNYFIFPLGFYSKLEINFMNKIGVNCNRFGKTYTAVKFDSITQAIFKPSLSGGANTEALKLIKFLKAKSVFEQAKVIKHSILSYMENDPTLAYYDFTVIASSETTLNTTSIYFAAENIPFNSSYAVNSENGLIIILNALRIGLHNDAVKAVDYYNYYFKPEDIQTQITVNFNNSQDIWGINEVLNELKSPAVHNLMIDFNQNDKDRFRQYLEILASIQQHETFPLDKILTLLQAKINQLQKLLKDKNEIITIYSYQKILNKIFGHHLKINEVIDYLLEILYALSKNRIGRDYKGVQLILMNELYLDSRYLYFTDLEENNFLKNNYYNKLMDEESFLNLETEIYGQNKADNIQYNFKNMLTESAENVHFVLPDYGDETVISSYIENLLQLFPKTEYRIEIVGNPNLKIDNMKFSLKARDLLHKEVKSDLIPSVDTGFHYIEQIVDGEYQLKVHYQQPLEDQLTSISKIEKFSTCPARFVHELNLKYDKIETRDQYKAGTIFHEIVENVINYYQNKDLLANENEFAVFKELSSKNGILIKKQVNQFIKAYLLTKTNQNNALAEFNKPVYQKIGSIFDAAQVIPIFSRYQFQELTLDPNNKDKLQKELVSILRFLVYLVHDIGISPRTVTQSFRTEVLLHHFSLGPNMPLIEKAFIDFLFIDNDRRLRIIDFKSSSLNDYPDEMKNYHIVQLLIYREAVKNSLIHQQFSCFNDEPIKAELQKMERTYSTVDQAYFSGMNPVNLNPDQIIAYYLSPKDTFKVMVNEAYRHFLEMLYQRQQNRPEFSPETNLHCRYCSLGAGCHMFEDSNINLSVYADHFQIDPEQIFTDYPRLDKVQFEEKSSGLPVKKFIQFSENKAAALKVNRQDTIISAGAGSGKTEVLAAKYIKLLLDEELRLENIVCITFTNKAVGEMKNRIMNRLSETIESGCFFSIHNGNTEGYKLTPDKINRLIKAKKDFYQKNRIRTFHSFCMNILEKYGKKSDTLKEYDLECDIAPEFYLEEEKVKIIKTANKDNYNTFLKPELITEQEKQIFFNWLQHQIFYYKNENTSGGFLSEILKLITSINLCGKKISEWHFDLAEYKKEKSVIFTQLKSEFTLLKKKAQHQLSQIERSDPVIKEIRQDIESDTFSISLGNRLRCRKTDTNQTVLAVDALKQTYQTIKKTLYFIYKDRRDTTEEEFAVKKAVFIIANGVMQQIEEYKKEKNYIEQDDFHLQVIKLLENDPHLLEELQSEIKYFLLDEFQDTNWLQSKIIQLLHKKNKNYLFIVGDLKQSIYRFQQCDNQIFYQYMKKPGINYLTFRENYRSDQAIVGLNNYFFSRNNFPNFNIFYLTSRNQADPEFAIPVNKNPIPAVINFTQICYDKEQYPDLSAAELNHIAKIQEAEYICNMIKANAQTKWGILIRSYTRIDYLIETLKNYHIPYTFIMKGGLFDFKEVTEFISLLKLLAGVILTEELSYIENLSSLTAAVHDEAVLEKGLFYTAMYTLNSEVYQNHLKKFKNYNQKMVVLLQVLDIFNEAVDRVGDNLIEIFSYIDKSAHNNNKDLYANEDNTVKIMTVHSAKGLEFDNLFVININNRDIEDHDLIKFVNLVRARENYIDFCIKGIKDIIGEDETSFWHSEWMDRINAEFTEKEAANLLYVALTRAKKNIFVTMLKNSLSADSDLLPSKQWLKNIDQNLFAPNFNNQEYGQKTVTIGDPPVTIQLNRLLINQIAKTDPQEDDVYIRLEKKYQVNPRKIKTLTSVTQSIQQTDPQGKTTETPGNNNLGFSPADLGNLVHKFLEINLNYFITQQFKVEPHHFTDLYRRFIADDNYPDKLILAAETTLKNALYYQPFQDLFLGNQYRYCEQNLIFRHEAPEYDYLEGYIDLLVVNKDNILIIDYKTHITAEDLNPELLKQYCEQIGLYMQAINKIFPGQPCSQYLYKLTLENAELIKIKNSV